MLTINTNSTSLVAQGNLNKSQSALSTSLQRLSSGMRINSAADDAAGLAISSRMSSQISGLNQAVRNANDGVSLVQTADGALSSVSDALQRMRDLAVQASNATNSASDRAALQGEVNQLVQQINSVGDQTTFNGVKLLDGTFNAQSFQVGANSGESITVSSIASAKANALGVGTTSSYTTSENATVATGTISAGGITVNGYGVGPSVGDGVSASTSYNSAAGTAYAQTTDDIAAGDLKINGVSIGAITRGAADTAITSATAIATQIQTDLTAAGVTNVTATDDGAGHINLQSLDGTAITISQSGTATTARTGLVAGTYAAGSDSAIAKAAAFNAVSGQTGVTAKATATTVSGGALTANGAITGTGTNFVKINGVNLGAIAAGTNANFTDQGNNIAAAVNAVSNQTGVTATFNTTTLKVDLTAVDGRNIDVEVGAGTTAGSVSLAGAAGGAASATITHGGVVLNSSSAGGITLGGSDLATTNLGAGTQSASATFGTGVASVDISTASGAQNAITTIDSAIQNINNSRASLGALQNRFTSAISNLQTTSTNLSSARSRIQDTDFASETANMTRNQILQQAGTAMLAQANSLPQSVLSLLK